MRIPSKDVVDLAEERGRVGAIRLPVSVRVGAGLAQYLYERVHCCEVQGELIRMLAEFIES